jgi:muramoyltetrapeptide carboxypeptidase
MNRKTLKPPALRKGDKIGIISPSEPIIYKKKFLRGVETLKNLGFRVVLGKNVFKEYGAYMAGTDKERASDLNAMFKNPEIKGIFCSLGGFNSNRLLDLIDYRIIKKNPKVFFGFSDITVLLNAIYKKTGLITFHGQNIEYGFSQGFSGKNKYTYEYFSKAVMNNKPIGLIKNQGKPIEILKKGKANGKLVGGNLSVLMTLLGTEYEPDWSNKILFWEDTDEEVKDDIDFWLTHLRLCKVFEKILGMVIGKIADYDIKPRDADWIGRPFSLNKIILEICKNYKFPIIKGVAFGHYYPQITIPIGVKATIDTSKKLFSIDESGVE